MRRTGANNATYVEIDGVRYPLVEGSEVQRRPLTQFPGANQIGPNERPSKNPALSSIVFAANTQRGMGTRKHAVLDGIDTFRYAWGFDTRFPGGIVPTPKVDALTQCPLAANGGDWALNGAVKSRYAAVPGSNAELIYFFAPDRQTLPAFLFAYNIVANTWTAIAGGAKSVLQWRGDVVAVKASTGVIMTSATDGVTFANRDASDWAGLAEFGNRLWSFRNTDGKLYSCTDPTLNVGGASGCWTPQSERLYLNSDEEVRELQVSRDRGGNPALLVVTTYRIHGFDDESGEFELFEDLRKWAKFPITPLATRVNIGNPQLYEWMRTKLLYALPLGASGAGRRHVYQFSGNTDEVGPTERGGFSPLVSFDQFRALDGNVHWLYAACAGNGVHTAGEVVAMNDLGGWHTIYHPYGGGYAESNPILGLCVVGDSVYVMFKDGKFEAIRDRDEMTAASLRYASGEIAPGMARIYFARTDEGLPNHEKLGAFVRIALADRSALPTGYEMLVNRLIDPTYGEVSVATLTDADTFPIEIPLPDNDPEDQSGLAHNQIELAVYLYDAVAGTMTDVVTIEEVTLYWQKWVEPKWAYQMVIDLREESFRKFAATTDEGRGLGTVRGLLEATVAARAFHRIKYGGVSANGDEWETDIKAADLVLAGRENPLDGSGLFPITFRNVAAEE